MNLEDEFNKWFREQGYDNFLKKDFKYAFNLGVRKQNELIKELEGKEK